MYEIAVYGTKPTRLRPRQFYDWKPYLSTLRGIVADTFGDLHLNPDIPITKRTSAVFQPKVFPEG